MPLVLAISELQTGDWVVLGAYFAALVLAGVWASRGGSKTTEDYFLASRSMPVWAVAFSILSTAQSAATYVGVPAAAYRSDLTYLSSSIGGVIAAVLLATVVIPVYYRLGVSTPYQLLERRFGTTGRIAAATAYLVGRVFASGARVFIAAIPAAVVLFGPQAGGAEYAILIAFFTLLGIGLCFFGGVRSVIWIDVLQVTVYLGAAVAAIVVLLNRIHADPATIAAALSDPGNGAASKLRVFSLSTDPAQTFTLWTALTGFVLLTVASHGADQDLVQRMLTCRSAAKGAWSVISGVLIGVPAVFIFLVLGLLLWVFYNRPDLVIGSPSAPGVGPDKVFGVFALREMSGGLAGLVIAGLFACGPAGINSGLSAMSSSFVGDIYKHLRPNRDERHYLLVGRAGVVGAGLALGAMALLCILWYNPEDSTILDFVLSVMTFAYAGLLGVFFTAFFTRRGNAASAIAALLVGAATQVLFQPTVLRAIASVTGSDWLPELRLAFPWQLTLGAAVSFLVCFLGSPHADDEPASRRADQPRPGV